MSIKLTTILIFLFLIISHLFSCSDDDFQISRVNIILWDQPLDTIREHVKGKWKWHYSKGGFTGKDLKYHQNSFIHFKENDSIRLVFESQLIYDTTIYWKRIRNILDDSTYLITIYNKVGDPYYPFTSWIVHGIQEDTLQLYDNSSDGYGHYLTK